MKVVAAGTEPHCHRWERRVRKNILDTNRGCGFTLTNIPIRYASPIVPGVQAIGIVVGCQRAERRSGDRYLLGAEPNVPIDVVFEYECGG